MLGFPFMCLASLGDMVVPMFIGKVIDQMAAVDPPTPKEDIMDTIKVWVYWLVAGSVCTFLNKLIFGYTCELVGT